METPVGATMAIQPNLNGVLRFVYVVAGLAMMAWGFFYSDQGFGHYAWPILGASVLLAGIIGYCPLMAMLGLGVKKRLEP
jgi:hypothetical protein